MSTSRPPSHTFQLPFPLAKISMHPVPSFLCLAPLAASGLCTVESLLVRLKPLRLSSPITPICLGYHIAITSSLKIYAKLSTISKLFGMQLMQPNLFRNFFEISRLHQLHTWLIRKSAEAFGQSGHLSQDPFWFSTVVRTQLTFRPEHMASRDQTMPRITNVCFMRVQLMQPDLFGQLY